MGFISAHGRERLYSDGASRVIRHKLIRSFASIGPGYNSRVYRSHSLALIDVYSARELVVPTPGSICTFVFSVSSLEIVKHASTPRNLSTQNAKSTHEREPGLSLVYRKVLPYLYSCSRARAPVHAIQTRRTRPKGRPLLKYLKISKLGTVF